MPRSTIRRNRDVAGRSFSLGIVSPQNFFVPAISHAAVMRTSIGIAGLITTCGELLVRPLAHALLVERRVEVDDDQQVAGRAVFRADRQQLCQETGEPPFIDGLAPLLRAACRQHRQQAVQIAGADILDGADAEPSQQIRLVHVIGGGGGELRHLGILEADRLLQAGHRAPLVVRVRPPHRLGRHVEALDPVRQVGEHELVDMLAGFLGEAAIVVELRRRRRLQQIIRKTAQIFSDVFRVGHPKPPCYTLARHQSNWETGLV